MTALAYREDVADRTPVPLQERGWPEWWPLAAVFVGFPVWWLLGLSWLVPILSALPMAAQLWRRRDRLLLPPAFGWWLLFMVWVLISVSALRTDAPGGVPGGGGLGRLAVYGYRLSWYVAATIVVLWAVNASRSRVSFERVANLVGWLFVWCVLGGLLGTLVPTLPLSSLVEIVLPKGLTANGFVQSLVHPGLAEVQTVLGRPEARPKAPFAFANTWGSVFSLTLPFFWVGWLLRGRHWQRVAAPIVLCAGAVPVVLSLNRGLWIALLVGALLMVLVQALRGRLTSLVLVVVGLAALAVALVASPLGSVVVERIHHGHSNSRRALLLQATVASTLQGSPIIGFGNTRDVQGNFTSIAGGSTASCAACGVPPLGTQGHLWLVIFSQGLLGALIFVLFFALLLSRSVRCRGAAQTVATLVLVFFGLQVFVYDTLGVPLLLVVLAAGFAAREGAWGRGPGLTTSRAGDGWRKVRPLLPVTSVLACVGLVAGVVVAFTVPRSYTASEQILLAPVPAYLTQLPSGRSLPSSTIDTESAMLLSDAVLAQVASPGQGTAELRQALSVTAPSNTSVLVLSAKASSAGEADELAAEVGQAYLASRQAALEQRRTDVLETLQQRYDLLSGLALPATPASEDRTRRPRTTAVPSS